MTENDTTSPNMTSADIIRLAVDGHEAAQRILYETHYASALRLAYLLLRDICDAEDAVQEAFIYVLGNLHRYDDRRGSFLTWLRVVLVSRCRNKRRRKRLPLVSLEMLDAVGRVPSDSESANDPVSMLEQIGPRRVLWDALQQISPGARDALVLRYYEGLSYTEIAQTLRCSNEAARARVAYGKTQLRRLLAASKEDVVSPGVIIRRVKAG
jgi:RNA polymerase sigma factor (sigma-70 family)